MVEHNLSASMHLSRSSSMTFYAELQQQQQIQQLEDSSPNDQVCGNVDADLARTPTEKDNYFANKLSQSLTNSLNESSEQKLFKLGNDDESDDYDDDIDYEDKYFNFSNSPGSFMFAEINENLPRVSTQTSAPINMIKLDQSPVSNNDSEDMSNLSSTLKESNFVVPASSICETKTKKSKNKKKRQNKNSSTNPDLSKEITNLKEQENSNSTGIKIGSKTCARNILKPSNDAKTDRILRNMREEYLEDDFEFFLDNDLDNTNKGAYFKTSNINISNSKIQLNETNDDDSCTENYFLASSVDTVINTSFLRAAMASINNSKHLNTSSVAQTPASTSSSTSSSNSNFLSTFAKSNPIVNNDSNQSSINVSEEGAGKKPASNTFLKSMQMLNSFVSAVATGTIQFISSTSSNQPAAQTNQNLKPKKTKPSKKSSSEFKLSDYQLSEDTNGSSGKKSNRKFRKPCNNSSSCNSFQQLSKGAQTGSAPNSSKNSVDSSQAHKPNKFNCNNTAGGSSRQVKLIGSNNKSSKKW